MTTATPLKVAAGKRVPWDFFLDQEGSTLSDDVRTGHLAVLKRHVDAFRSRDWKVIRHELKHHYGVELPDGLEPHWVAPGKARMWHQPVTQHVRGELDGNNGRNVMVLEDAVADWQPSHVVSIGNASNLAYQLRKGLRLRPPPVEGAESVEMLDAATPPDSAGEPSIDPNPYVCNRHVGTGVAKFPTWRAYLRHCQEEQERPAIEPPAEVVRALQTYPYYCPMCYIGFTTEKAASMHVDVARSTPMQVPSGHISLSQMMRRVPDGAQAAPATKKRIRNKSNRRQ